MQDRESVSVLSSVLGQDDGYPLCCERMHFPTSLALAEAFPESLFTKLMTTCIDEVLYDVVQQELKWRMEIEIVNIDT